jgi:hypothetical protein
MVAILRFTAGRDPADAALAALVAELSAQSVEFGRMWADCRVFRHTHGTKRFHHEAVGTMSINYETLVPPTDPHLWLIIYTADTGSPSAERLTRLADLFAVPA